MNNQGVLLSVFNSKNLVNGIGERFSAILKTSMRSERFLLASRVHRFRRSICMCNCWLLSLAYYRIVMKMPWCALLTAVKNYNKSLEKLQDFFFKTETKTKTS